MVIRFMIRSSARKVKPKEVPVYVRVRDDVIDIWQRTAILVEPEKWDPKEEKIRSRVVMNEQDRADFNNSINNLRVFITKKYADASQGQRMREDWLPSVLKLYAKLKSSPAPREKKKDIGELFDRFLDNRDCAESRKKQYRVVKRVLQRYELFVRETRQKNFNLDVRKVDSETLYDLWNFMENENIWYETYPDIYEKIPNTKKVPQARGRNTIVGCFKRLRAFLPGAKTKSSLSAPLSRISNFRRKCMVTPYTLPKMKCLNCTGQTFPGVRNWRPSETYSFSNAVLVAGSVT